VTTQRAPQNTAATVIKPLHMPLQAGIPGLVGMCRPSSLPASVAACFSMTVPQALNSTIDY